MRATSRFRRFHELNHNRFSQYATNGMRARLPVSELGLTRAGDKVPAPHCVTTTLPIVYYLQESPERTGLRQQTEASDTDDISSSACVARQPREAA
jgi:hypothetical protein